MYEMGLFDEELVVCEDYDMWLKVTSLYPVGFIKQPITVKYGGHSDQLSKMTAKDYWRVRALERILKIRSFDDDTKLKIKNEIVKKAVILKKGHVKHGNLKNLSYFEELVEQFSTRGRII